MPSEPPLLLLAAASACAVCPRQLPQNPSLALVTTSPGSVSGSVSPPNFDWALPEMVLTVAVRRCVCAGGVLFLVFCADMSSHPQDTVYADVFYYVIVTISSVG